MDFSIIVTVYNKEEFLSRCLGSLFEQQFSGTFEVIAVDDGSTDGSHEVLKKMQEGDKRLQLITLPVNRKQAFARETGMKSAVGDYILHLDSDDWLLPGALERIYAKLRETNADVLAFNFLRVFPDGTSLHPLSIKEEKVTRVKHEAMPYFMGGSGTRVVRREITVDLISSGANIDTTEDLLYNVEILYRATTICLIPDEFYVYFVNQKSVTWTKSIRGYLQNQVIVLRMLDEILQNYERDPIQVRGVLEFLEKWVFTELAESHFVKREKQEMVEGLPEAFVLFPEYSKKDLRNLHAAFRNKYRALHLVRRRSGIRSAAGIVYRGMKNRMAVMKR